MKIIVALFKVNTQVIQFYSLYDRTLTLRRVIGVVFDELRWLNPPNPAGGVRGIFLAPEYLFAEPTTNGHVGHQQGDRRHMDQQEMEKLRQEFHGLSVPRSGLLLIPGTVAWRERRSTDESNRMLENAIYGQTVQTYYGSLAPGAHTSLKFASAEKGPHPTLLVTPTSPPLLVLSEFSVTLELAAEMLAVKSM
jgi:hypothetical protein